MSFIMAKKDCMESKALGETGEAGWEPVLGRRTVEFFVCLVDSDSDLVI